MKTDQWRSAWRQLTPYSVYRRSFLTSGWYCKFDFARRGRRRIWPDLPGRLGGVLVWNVVSHDGFATISQTTIATGAPERYLLFKQVSCCYT